MNIKDIQSWAKQQKLEDQWQLALDQKMIKGVFRLQQIHKISQQHPDKSFKLKPLQHEKWLSLDPWAQSETSTAEQEQPTPRDPNEEATPTSSKPSLKKKKKALTSTSKAARTKPSTSKAARTKPSTSKAARTKPSTSKAARTKPSTSKAARTKPSQSKPERSKNSTSSGSPKKKTPKAKRQTAQAKPSAGTPWLIMAVVALLLAGGGATYWMTASDSSHRPDASLVEKTETEKLSAKQVELASQDASIPVAESQMSPDGSAKAPLSETKTMPPRPKSSFKNMSLEPKDLGQTQELFTDIEFKAPRYLEHEHHDEFEGKKNVHRYEKKRDFEGKKTTFIFEKSSTLALEKGNTGLLHTEIKWEGSEPITLRVELKLRDVQRDKSEFPITRDITLSSAGWTELNIPFQASTSADSDNISFSLRTTDTFEQLSLANFKIWKVQRPLKELPLSHVVSFPQRQDDSWKREANARIQEHRMAPLKIKLTKNGQLMDGVEVRISQQRHHFQHGSAMKYSMITGKSEEAEQYRRMAKELFNSSSAENAQKWRIMLMGRQKRIEEKRQMMIQGNRWLKENGLPVRGHVLVWPGFKKLPVHYGKAHENGNLDWDGLRSDILKHIEQMGEWTKDDTFEWDVLNEPYSNHDLTDHFGNEIMLEWFVAAKKAFPHHGLYLNDYGILRTGEHNLKHRKHFFETIQYFVDHQSEMNGFAMQGHFDEGNLNSPEGLWDVLSKLGEFDMDMRISEFDCDSHDEELVADYLECLLTLSFSHPKIVGFQTWGFWEKTMNIPTSALVKKDWSLSPAGIRYKDLLFKRWWTQEETQSDHQGSVSTRVFYGKHEITARIDDQSKSIIVDVHPDKTQHIVNIDF